MPLRYILKNSPITVFEISMTNADGTRRTDTQLEQETEPQPATSKKG